MSSHPKPRAHVLSMYPNAVIITLEILVKPIVVVTVKVRKEICLNFCTLQFEACMRVYAHV